MGGYDVGAIMCGYCNTIISKMMCTYSVCIFAVDLWFSEEEREPVVYHGHTLTSKLPVRKALLAIKEYAFEASQ